MKAFTGLLAILLLGAILGKDISKEDRHLRTRRSSGTCVNYAGSLYHFVKESLPEGENFSVSPVGLFTMLSTLIHAADFFTSAVEISNLIHLKCGTAKENDPASSKPQRIKVTLATVALIREGLTVNQKFVDYANEVDTLIYRTNFSPSNFKADFNKFVSSKTNESYFLGKDSLFKEPPPEATRLLFYSHLKLQAQFEQKFSLDDKKNLIGPQMQALHGNVPELKARVLGLPLLNSNKFLLILLPDKGATLKDVEQGLRNTEITSIPSKLKPTVMDITIEPIAENKYLYLRKAFEKAGITKVFDKSQASLSELNLDLAVDNIMAVSGMKLTQNGINTEVSTLQKPASTSEMGKGKALEFKAKGPLVYVILGPEYVYIIGRWSGKKS